LPACHDDGGRERRAHDAQRDQHESILGGSLGADISVDPRIHSVVRRPVLVEKGLSPQEERLLRCVSVHSSLEGDGRCCPLAQPSLLGDTQVQDRTDEVRSRRQDERSGVARENLMVAYVIGGKERLRSRRKIATKSRLRIEHAVVSLVESLLAGEQVVDGGLEVSENGGEANPR